MTVPHDDYAARQARMDAEYIEAGGDAPNHQKQFPQVFRGAPVDDVVQPEVYRADDSEPIGLSRGDTSTKGFIEFVVGMPEEKFRVRQLAFARLVGLDHRSFAELAKVAGTSTATFRREYWRVNQILRGSEGEK
jgi:hypothetical protein